MAQGLLVGVTLTLTSYVRLCSWIVDRPGESSPEKGQPQRNSSSESSKLCIVSLRYLCLRSVEP